MQRDKSMIGSKDLRITGHNWKYWPVYGSKIGKIQPNATTRLPSTAENIPECKFSYISSDMLETPCNALNYILASLDIRALVESQQLRD